MSATQSPPACHEVQPLPGNICSTQPGGGSCYRVELVWGRWRRWWLKRFRPGFVRRMAALRRGDARGAPHEVLDPRDLKYVRNQCQCDWDPSDDPFRWRERLPWTRYGLAELQLIGWPLLMITVALGYWFWYLAPVPGLLLGLIVYFFRDPPRRVPREPGLIVSPADGRVVELTELNHDEFIGGPAVRIGIFLSIFDVHLNRAPAESRVLALRYSPGEFLNALRAESARRNENMWIGLEQTAPPHRRLAVRQISGTIARRIVCDLRPGEVISRGAKFGMIKLGSRTELILPKTEGLEIQVKLGWRVKAGSSVLARHGKRQPEH